MLENSYITPKYKINLAPKIFELGGDNDNSVILVSTRNAKQPETIRDQTKGEKSPWQKDKR